MTTQTFQERINDTNKVQLSDGFIHKIKATASLNNISTEDVWQKWVTYSNYCRNADQSAIFSEFCDWNKLTLDANF